ncbi:hypothetical protein DV096_15350 [Bradymonadaceae bacterium TMQ3]|nr:hypothetical protein DV096_15350 [Bradymonadaceae bacterium TMQ3]
MLPFFGVIGLWLAAVYLYPVGAITAALPVLLMLVVGWVHLHRVGYEAVYAAEGARLPMKSWFVRVMRGVVVAFGLNFIGSMFFFVPSLVAQILLMPYLLFIMVEGEEPIEALKINVRLAGNRMGSLFVFWLTLRVGAVMLMILGGMAPVAAYIALSDAPGPISIVEMEWVMWTMVALGCIVAAFINYSIAIAGAIAAYRVLRGKSVDAMEAVGRREEGAGLPTRW